VIKSFRDTISVAKLSGASYNNGDGETSDATGEPGDEAPADRFGRGREGRRQAAIDQNAEKAGTVAYSWPLGGGTDVQLVFSGEPTQKNIDILLAQLTIVREIMPTEVAPPPPPTPLTSTPLTE
jgi:hypothetical protein